MGGGGGALSICTAGGGEAGIVRGLPNTLVRVAGEGEEGRKA